MGVRDMIAYAADQYGADRGLLDSVARLESGYRTNVQNNWDSNAKAGIPSYGLFQFVQPTFASFAREAAKAKPGLWARYNGNFDYRDPRQQALAAAWGFANGKASHWSTSDRARSAANEYNYQPRWRMGGAQGTTTQQAVNPQQLAAVKADFDKAIQFGQQQVKDATQRVGRFDALTDEQKQQLNYRYGAREAQNMDMRQRSAMAQGLTAAQQNVADMRSGAKADLAGAQANLTKLQQQREQTIDKLANMQLPDPSSELGRMSNGIRSQLVATARQEVGTVAAQAMKYIRASGGTGYEAWCGDFVRYVFKQNGLTPPPARYVPDLLKWAQGNDTLRKTGRAGDLAMFDWNNDGVPDHVELVTGGRGAGRYQTIGGNTSGNRGSSQVAQKLRTGNILGFVDVLSALGVKA